MMAAKKLPSFDYSICMACAACLPVCPFGCIDLSKLGIDRYRKAYPKIAHPGDCTGCGLCSRACPVDCISLIERP
jgi:energy-converting hydrogenase A subunit P